MKLNCRSDIIAKELEEIKEHLPSDVKEGFSEIDRAEDKGAQWMRRRRRWKKMD